MKQRYKTIIVGGGAAGLYLAASLAAAGAGGGVLLVEGQPRTGRKLSLTGNGQGNVSNTDMSAAHYRGGNAALIADIISEQPLSLFSGLFTSDGRGRIYPAGRQASALADDLRNKAEAGGVTLLTGKTVVDIQKGFTAALSDGSRIAADSIVLAAGGKAQKSLGTDGSAYALAEKFGHSVTPLYPSLVQLKTETAAIKQLKGLRTDCVITARCGGGEIARADGEIIFADYGVTGSAVFNISPRVTDRQGVTLYVDLAPALTEKQLVFDINRKISEGFGEDALLDLTFHRQLGRAIIRASKDKSPEDVARTAKNFALNVTGNLGFDSAQVTRGGVALDGVTGGLESKYMPGLYFAGEILDADGDCGGYNLHWAFASALRVSRSLLKAAGHRSLGGRLSAAAF